MPRNASGSKRRIVDAALELFTSQGFEATTTKQIAELARANEATLFRNFGSKQDLLLAVIEDSGVFTRLPSESFGPSGAAAGSLSEAVKHYARDRLRTLGQLSELLRAFIGVAGQYSSARRQAFGQELLQGTQAVARYFATYIEREQLEMQVSPAQFVGLLDSALFGYLMTELTSESHALWRDREEFLDSLVEVCLQGLKLPATSGSHEALSALPRLASPPAADAQPQPTELSVADLPADLARKILQQAKKQGPQHYALIYLLFGAGLLPEEVLGLTRSHHICTPRQHSVRVTQGAVRQVPINQWIMGKRYGSYGNNPLSQWLKSRKDEAAALFVSEDRGQPLTEPGLIALWQDATANLLTPEHAPPRLIQARQTWCVEMLMKGMNPEDLGILSGLTPEKLQPYVRRAREKAALERAIRLDNKQPN